MLEVTALCCFRGEREILHDLQFKVPAGSWLHVRGENGAGKTTLLRALCGLLRPASGQIAWNGDPIDANRDQYHQAMTYLGHTNGLKEDLNVEENLLTACAIAGTAPAMSVESALGLLGFSAGKTRQVRTLSQGQKRRVALARVALSGAKLWILDEPLAALDNQAIVNVAALLDQHLESGGSLVLTSHQPVNLSRPAAEILLTSTAESAR